MALVSNQTPNESGVNVITRHFPAQYVLLEHIDILEGALKSLVTAAVVMEAGRFGKMLPCCWRIMSWIMCTRNILC